MRPAVAPGVAGIISCPRTPVRHWLPLWCAMAATPRAAAAASLATPSASGDSRFPSPVRISAAARAAAFGPRSRTAGQWYREPGRPASRPAVALDRLRQLQHQIEKCDALDALIVGTFMHINWPVRNTRVRLARVEMIKHLWCWLMLDQGKTRTTARFHRGTTGATPGARGMATRWRASRGSLAAWPVCGSGWQATPRSNASFGWLWPPRAEHRAGLSPGRSFPIARRGDCLFCRHFLLRMVFFRAIANAIQAGGERLVGARSEFFFFFFFFFTRRSFSSRAEATFAAAAALAVVSPLFLRFRSGHLVQSSYLALFLDQQNNEHTGRIRPGGIAQSTPA